ncbi:MAG: hypothetical protein ACJAWQ_001957 [Paraglaciecola sp.]|jgi:hypothetical protein
MVNTVENIKHLMCKNIVISYIELEDINIIGQLAAARLYYKRMIKV